MDIIRNNNLVSLDKEPRLLDKHIEIQLAEKQSAIQALKLRLEDLMNIEMKKISLQIDLLEKEIEQLESKKSINYNKIKEN